jgi:hypothetical protein
VVATSWPLDWITPQFTRLVDEAPPGEGWLHEIEYDSYRTHARIDGGRSSCGLGRGRTGPPTPPTPPNGSHRADGSIRSIADRQTACAASIERPWLWRIWSQLSKLVNAANAINS